MRERLQMPRILARDAPFLSGLKLQRRDIAYLSHVRREIEHLSALERQPRVRRRRSFPGRRIRRRTSRSRRRCGNRRRRQGRRRGLSRHTHRRNWRRSRHATFSPRRPLMHKVVGTTRDHRNEYDSDSSFPQAHNPYATHFPNYALPGLVPSYNTTSRESGRGHSCVRCIEGERTKNAARPSPDCVRAAILSHHSSTRSVVVGCSFALLS